MRIDLRSSAFLLSGLAAGAIAVRPDGVAAAAPDEPARHELTVQLGPIGAPDAPASGAASVAAAMPRGAVLYRFGARLANGRGARPDDVAWHLDLFASHGDGRVAPVARLSHSSQDVVLPRPFGIRLEPADSIVITLRLADPGPADGTALIVTITYEPLGGPSERLPVLAMQTPAASCASLPGTAVLWLFRPEQAGRVVAIAGALLASAREIVIEDAATGATVWRVRFGAPDGPEFARPTGVIRPSVVLAADRSYRLIAHGTGPCAATADPLQVLVMPAHPVSARP